MDKVLIVDGHNFMWRANITFKPPQKKVIASTEENRNQITEDYVIVFNFFRNFRALLETFSPTKCFFVLEGHPQFRYDLYADYKANRIIKTGSQLESRERFEKGQPEIVRLLKSLPCTMVRAEKYECDDVVATLIENMKDENVTVVSNDSDYIQLLQNGYQNLTIYNPFTKTNMVAPDYHYLAWKSLAGDTSDNIVGSVGKDKAKTLVRSPDKLALFLEKEEHRANFNINRQLIELRLVPLEELIFEEGQTNFDLIKEEFTRMEFKTILKEPYWTTFKDTFSCIKI